MNKLKLELMEDWLADIAESIIKDVNPGYFMWKEWSLEDESKTIDVFDELQSICNKRDMDNYDLLNYGMWCYLWMTSKKWLSDSEKNELKDYIKELRYVYEENQYEEEDYDDDKGELWMTAENKYQYDKSQRELEYNKIMILVDKI